MASLDRGFGGKEARAFLGATGMAVAAAYATLHAFLFAYGWWVEYRTLGLACEFHRPLLCELGRSFAWVAVLPLLAWVVRRFPLERRLWKRHAAAYIGLVCLVLPFLAAVDTAMALAWRQLLPPWEATLIAQGAGAFLLAMLHATSAFRLTIFVAVTAALHGWLLARSRAAREREAATTEARLASLRLQARRARIEPALLLGTLDRITALTAIDPGRADTMIADLSDVLRAILDDQESDQVPFQRELWLLESVLRLGSGSDQPPPNLTLDIPPQARDALVPNHLLLPFAEQAIRHHASSPSDCGCVYTVRARVEEENTFHVELWVTCPSAAHAPGCRGWKAAMAKLTSQTNVRVRPCSVTPLAWGTSFELPLALTVPALPEPVRDVPVDEEDEAQALALTAAAEGQAAHGVDLPPRFPLGLSALIWGLLAVAFTSLELSGRAADVPAWVLLVRVPMVFVVCFALSRPAWALARRFRVARHTWWRALPVHLLLAMAFSVVVNAITWWGHVALALLHSPSSPGPLPSLTDGFPSHLLGDLGWGAFLYWLLVGSYHAALQHVDWRRSELLVSGLGSQLAAAQLDLVRTQLNPHFLFNALQSISTLVHSAPDTAREMLERLASLLRVTLQGDMPQLVPLEQELTMARQFLEIQELRFQSRLRVEWQVDPAAAGLMVPSLLTQPLVENAIKHGIARVPGPGWVRVGARLEDAHLLIEVANSGAGVRNGGGARGGGGLGLTLVRRRLRQLYGRHHSFTVSSADGTVVATVRLPLAPQCRDLPAGLTDPAAAWIRPATGQLIPG